MELPKDSHQAKKNKSRNLPINLGQKQKRSIGGLNLNVSTVDELEEEKV